jgi:hypothetical protein
MITLEDDRVIGGLLDELKGTGARLFGSRVAVEIVGVLELRFK